MGINDHLERIAYSILSATPRNRRGILRFRDPDDYLPLLRLLRVRAPGLADSPFVRPLDLIRGLACRLNGDALNDDALLLTIVWEDDAPVAAEALPQGAIVSETGVPWGVRRVQAPRVWNRTTGHRVRVGVIDTGADFGHPDLKHTLERGINLLQRMSLPQDDNGHGTHIAGTIAAANGLEGVLGVAPRSRIHPVKAFDHNGMAFVSDIILGIDWCVRNRMQVVNMSFGMKTRSRALQAAVSGAYRAGVLIVASSGNDGRKGQVDYPARYPQTLAVGATDRRGRIAPFTNRSGAIDVYAPGDRIVSAWLRGRHREMSGTSMATSHVTGAVALLLALRPELTPEQIKTAIRHSSRPLANVKAPRTAGELQLSRLVRTALRL